MWPFRSRTAMICMVFTKKSPSFRRKPLLHSIISADHTLRFLKLLQKSPAGPRLGNNRAPHLFKAFNNPLETISPVLLCGSGCTKMLKRMPRNPGTRYKPRHTLKRGPSPCVFQHREPSPMLFVKLHLRTVPKCRHLRTVPGCDLLLLFLCFFWFVAAGE